MATSKTIQPTGETISIPAMTDRPDMSVVASDLSKITDAANALNSDITSLKKFNYVDISDSTPVNISNKAAEAGVSVNSGNFIAAVAQDNEVICLPYYSSTYNKMYCALKDLNMETITGTKNIRVYYRT